MASSLPEKSSDVAKDTAWTKQAFRKGGHNAFTVKDVKDRAATKAAGVVAVAGNFGGEWHHCGRFYSFFAAGLCTE